MSGNGTATTCRGACGRDCPDTCSWIVQVREGRAERLRGDPNHPFTRGTLCAKVNHYLDRVYHPHRVLHPMKGVGPKAEGRFVRVAWNEALAVIAARWQTIIETDTAQAIWPYSPAGNPGRQPRFGSDGVAGSSAVRFAWLHADGTQPLRGSGRRGAVCHAGQRIRCRCRRSWSTAASWCCEAATPS
jgi:anaerobic selenocysteine-containing dehydrogenase